MTIKTTMGILAGKASHFVLSKLGRGSTLPGKIALKFDKDILDTLAKDYEIVVNPIKSEIIFTKINKTTPWTRVMIFVPLRALINR